MAKIRTGFLRKYLPWIDVCVLISSVAEMYATLVFFAIRLSFGINFPRGQHSLNKQLILEQQIKSSGVLPSNLRRGKRQACEYPCISFVFLVMPGEKGFPSKKRWKDFFFSCSLANVNFFALIFEDRSLKATTATPHCSDSNMWWAECGNFAYPEYDLRFTPGMVRLMDAGVRQSPVGSTVAFLSGTTIPLVSCPETVKRLEGKIFVEHIRFPTHSIYTPFNFPILEEQCKGSQWMSLPRQVCVCLRMHQWCIHIAHCLSLYMCIKSIDM